MRRRGRAATARAARLAVAGALLAACGGPLGPIAGGRLAGDVAPAPVDDWSFAAEHPHMEIEVRPQQPYSVKIHYYLADGRLYFEGGPNGWSRWRRFLDEDPRVRVRFGDRVYAGRAVAVTDAQEIGAVLPLFYAKDRDEPSPACAATWTLATCDFAGTFFRIEPAP